MKGCLLICFTLMFFTSKAQDTTVKRLQNETVSSLKKERKDTTNQTWKKGGRYNINLNQGTLTNWAAGGDDFSLSVNSILNLFLVYSKGRHNWDNSLDSYFGYLNTTSLGARKNDDRLDILSKYDYALTKKLNLAGLFNFRTQLFRGYTYKEDNKTLSSTFLAPAYILLSAGMDYRPQPFLSIFVSPLTSRWIVVKDDSLAARGLYGVDSGSHAASEFGAFITVKAEKDLSSVISYKGRLDLFSNYKHNPQNVDLFLSNAFFLKLTKVLTASWNFDMIYDDDVRLFGKEHQSPALQVKSLVGLGLSLTF